MTKRNKIIISITGIVLVLLILIGLTYGYYLTRIQGNTNDKSISINMANLELTYNDGNGLIEAKNIIPGEIIATKTFTVKNTGNAKINNYVVYLSDVINTFQDKIDLTLTLTCTSDIGNCNGNNITYPSTDTILITNDILVNETQSYELKVEFIETNDDQSDNMDKEMSGNILLKDIKSINNTIENNNGTNNLVVENAKLLSNYRIYGNSVQETRSGKNLLPYPYTQTTRTEQGVTFTDEGNGQISVTGSATNYASLTLISNLNVKEYINKNLTLSFNSNNLINMVIQISIYDSSKNTLSSISVSKDYTFTIPTNAATLSLILKRNNNGEVSGTIKPQLELGTSATEYEEYGAMPSPDYPSEIKSVGDLVTDTSDSNYGKYRIPIKVTGKNLFNVENYSLDPSDNSLRFDISELTIGEEYTISSTKPLKWIKISNSTTGYSSVQYNPVNTAYYNYTFTMTKHENIASSATQYLFIGIGNGFVKDISDLDGYKLQIETGNTKTDYEEYISPETTNIYLNEPLRKIGEYSDYVDFKSGKIIRNIGQYKFTGNEIWDKNNYPPAGAYQFTTKKTIFNNITTDVKQTLNTHFTTKSASNGSGMGTYYNLYPSTTLNLTTATEFKEWLKNNNVIINYVMTNSIEESLSIPNINVNSTRNYISIGTNTSPSNVELEIIK